jgi:adenylosuccinate synthase
MGDLLQEDTFLHKYNRLTDFLENAYGFKIDRKEELDELSEARERLRDNITDTIYYVNNAIKGGKRVIAEGANALMLDLDFGSYPFVTSSSTGVAGIASGLGIAPSKLETSIGVVKAYTTRVGSGPFPTEDFGEAGEHMFTKGREMGVTTGRRRRCGWLDLHLVKYTHMINNYSSINITKLDILDELAEIKICVGYNINGKSLKSMPSNLEDLAKVEPEYITMKGWLSDTSTVKDWADLPHEAKEYLSAIEEISEVPISWVGVGPDRENMLINPLYS